jgi:hypothetical protein
MRVAYTAVALSTVLFCSVPEAAQAFLIPASDYARFNYLFTAPAIGPFDEAGYGFDGFTTPNTFMDYQIQIFDSADNLLGSRTVLSLSAPSGETTFGTALTFPVPTTVKEGYFLFGPFTEAIDITEFYIGFGNVLGGPETEVLRFPDGGLTPKIYPPLSPVPEPGSLALLCAGLAGVVMVRRRKVNTETQRLCSWR